MLIGKSQDSVNVKLDSIDTPKDVLTAWQSTQLIDDPWDNFLAFSPFGHFYQTSIWAQVRTLDGWNPLIVLITFNDSLVGGFQILIRSKSYLGKIGLVLKGPVILSDDPAVINFVITTLKKTANLNNISALIVQPADKDNKINNIISQSDFSVNQSKTYSYFKVGFGGEVLRLTKGFVYINNPLLRWVYNFFMPILILCLF